MRIIIHTSDPELATFSDEDVDATICEYLAAFDIYASRVEVVR